MTDFTVITSVYRNDRPEFVRVALDSMLVYQSIPPTEIIMVQDGPISNELSELILDYKNKYPQILKIIKLTENQGLGNALRLGVENAKYNYIARMDSDDICDKCRFELQLSFLKQNPDVDIVGGQMSEFIDIPENIIAKREVPLDNLGIYKMMKSRCALNHVTVMFKRKAILDCGNYIDWFYNEDYYLWVRMMKNKCKFANLPETLVNVRTGIEQYSRRGGIKYFESEKGIKKLMLDMGLITRYEYCINIIIRFFIQILIPAGLRGWFYRNFARS